MADTFVENTAVASYKATIKMKGTSTFESIGDCTSVTIPGFDTAEIDVTHSLSEFAEFLGGRVTVGDVGVNLNVDPGGAAFAKILAASGKVKEFEISIDGPSATSPKVTFKALVRTFAWAGTSEGTVFSGTLTLKVSGKATFPAPA